MFTKKMERRETKIQTYTNYMKILAKKGNIFDPEATKLIEQGFEYICEIEGEKLFRKFA